VQKIVRGQTQLFDAADRGDHLRPGFGDEAHYFINAMDVGFGALAAQNLRPVKFPERVVCLSRCDFEDVIDYPTLHLRIQLDNLPPFDQSTTMTVITNGVVSAMVFGSAECTGR